MCPSRHRPHRIGRQQAAPHEDPQQAPGYALLHLGDGIDMEPNGGIEDDTDRGGGVEPRARLHGKLVEQVARFPHVVSLLVGTAEC